MLLSSHPLEPARRTLRLGKEFWESKEQFACHLLCISFCFPGGIHGLWTFLIFTPSAPFITENTRGTLCIAGLLGIEILAISKIWRHFLKERQKLPAPWNKVDLNYILQECPHLSSSPLRGIHFVYTRFGANRHQVVRNTPWHFRHSLNLSYGVVILYGWVKLSGIDALLIASFLALHTESCLLLMGLVQSALRRSRSEAEPRLDLRHKPLYAVTVGLEGLGYALCHISLTRDSPWAQYIVCLAMPIVVVGTLVWYLKHAHETEFVNPTKTIFGGCRATFCQVCKDTMLTEDSAGARKGNSHHSTLAGLESSARDGCRICSAVWQAASHIKRDFLQEMMFWRPSTTHSGLHVQLNGHSIDFELRSNEVADRWVKNLDIRHRLMLEPLPYHTGSEQSLQQARNWLHNCTVFHGVCCANHDHTFRPSRLVFVDNGSICIQAAKDMPARVDYLTLSHRWGGIVPVRLLESNEDSFREEIAWSILPKTFQDAVRITRLLGYSYIWIDSLCIVQDSEADWKHEAALMGRIYRNSACNIAASSAHDSTHGCLYPRNSRTLQPEVVSRRPGRQQYLFNRTDVYDEHVIYSRAWVLQEAFLARRTLDCGRGQLFWRCGEMRASEVFPGGVPTNIYHEDHPASKFKVISADSDQVIMNANVLIERLRTKNIDVLADQGRTSLEQFTDSPFAFWRHLVDHYMMMDVTYETDRVVAFDGIVEVFKTFFGEYYFGLWRIFMPAGLLWKSGGRQPSNHAVPSWSWFSIEGPVSLWVEFQYGRDILLSKFLGTVDDDRTKLRFASFMLKADRGYDFIEFDLPGAPADLDDLFLMCILVNKYRDAVQIKGLVVEQVKNGVYRRVGYFRDTQKQLIPALREAGKTTITLV